MHLPPLPCSTLPTHTSKFPCLLLFCSQNCFLVYLLSKTVNLKWKKEEFKQLHMKWWFAVTNPESVYVVSLFLKIQCTLKQIMKFIFQILFLQNKSPQFYFSPSPPCFTILKFLSSFFSCLGVNLHRELKQRWVCVCSRAGTLLENVTQNGLKSHLRTAENHIQLFHPWNIMNVTPQCNTNLTYLPFNFQLPQWLRQ